MSISSRRSVRVFASPSSPLFTTAVVRGSVSSPSSAAAAGPCRTTNRTRHARPFTAVPTPSPIRRPKTAPAPSLTSSCEYLYPKTPFAMGSCLPVSSHRKRSSQSNMSSATSFYKFTPQDKLGKDVPLEQYKGQVVLVVNTASKCGFTPQYAGLESLYYKLKQSHPDFTILGFPCNQFGGQEPGTDEDIQEFCQVNYGVSFPIMKKIDVNGDNAAPLYDWMKEEKPGLMGLKRIKWNFEKFLIGRDGHVKGRWASTTKPEALERAILDELNVKPSTKEAAEQVAEAEAPTQTTSAEAPAAGEQKL